MPGEATKPGYFFLPAYLSEGDVPAPMDSEWRSLQKWLGILHSTYGVQSLPMFPEQTQPLQFDDDDRLAIKINAIINSAAYAAGVAVTPETYPPLLAWWDASNLGYSDSTLINATTNPFTDRTGNGYDATTIVGPTQPVLRTGIINGKSVVRFDGTSDLLSFTPLSIPGYTGGVDSDVTIAFIGTSSNDGMILGLAGSNMQVRVGRSGANVISNFFGASDVVSLAFTNPASTPKMCVWRRTGILIQHRENKTDKTGIIPIPFPTDGSAFTMDQMGHYWAGNFLAGDIGEVMVWGSYLTDTQIDRLWDDYAQPKWGLIP